MRSHRIVGRERSLGPMLVALCLLSQFAIAPGAQQTEKPEAHYRELPNFHQVNARLYRGVRKLASLGVNTVINLRDDDEHERAEAEEAKAAGLRYFNVPFERLGRPTEEQVERVLSLIDAQENGVVFVHCAHGADRTGTIIAAYRISHDGWTSEQAKQEAARYGMKFWQRGMKDFIHDYYRDRTARSTPSAP